MFVRPLPAHIPFEATQGVCHVRFAWRMEASALGSRQTAYQLQVLDAGLKAGDGDLLFDSGKVDTDVASGVLCPVPLSSRGRISWRVRIWDESDCATAWSEFETVEIGLLDASDWSAAWISPAEQRASKEPSPPALLRKAFELASPIRRAVVHATARGVYTLALNGRRVGEDVLAPGWTSYRNRIQVQRYDVTDLLCDGANVLSACLGEGWFRGPLFMENRRNSYGPRTSLLVQLEIEHEDGSTSLVLSDGTWRHSTGAVLASELQHGDVQDARLDPKGWQEAGFDDAGWAGVDVLVPTTARLVSQSSSPLRIIERVAPIGISPREDGTVIVDFGQNLVGWVRLQVRGGAGETVVIRHAEVLRPDGGLYVENLRSARQTCTYTLAGEGTEVLEPCFSLQGFRYASIEGLGGPLEAGSIEAVVVHSLMDATGRFETSDPMLNQLQRNILWGQKGNFIDVPLDCPQRDERLGWTADAQVFAPTAAFNMDVSGFFAKWLEDVAVEQGADGTIPFVVPSMSIGSGAAGWSDVATFLPMTLYSRYGDRQALAEHYPMMRKWVAFMEERSGPDHIWRGFQFGDWLDFFSSTRGTDKGLTSEELIAQAFYGRSVALVAEAASILGDSAASSVYRNLFERICVAFQKRWVSSEGVIAEDTQAAYVFALAFDLLEPSLRPKVAARLAADVRNRGHLTTGFLATPLLLDALTRFGYLDLAYMLLERKEYPSWLYPITKGATTIWERWDGIRPDDSFQSAHMNSFNHYAYGAVGDWMYRTIGGIAPLEPGYKLVGIAPRPGGSLDWAKAAYNGPHGRIATAWHIDADGFHLDVTIPPNSEALVRLPGASPGHAFLNGLPIEECTELRDVRFDAEGVGFGMAAGSYTFAVTHSG